MNKKILLFSLLILISFSSFCQETWIAKYDSDWTEILTDSNDYSFRRVFSKLNNSTSSFVGYTNENVKLESGILKNKLLHGHYEYYFPNGKINFEGEYKNDKPIGIWVDYYTNGNKKSEYRANGELENDFSKNIISAWDSLGSPLIINGNGRRTVINDGFEVEENYVNGLLKGDTKIYNSSKKLIYTDTYQDGKFIKGYNHHLKTEYSNIYSLPKYKSGEESLEKEINKIWKGATNHTNVLGQRVNILPNFKEFEIEITISKEGKILDANLLNSKYNSNATLLIDAIMQTTTNWTPSILRGEKIEQTFVYSYSNKGTFFSHKSALNTFGLIGSYSGWSMMNTINK